MYRCGRDRTEADRSSAADTAVRFPIGVVSGTQFLLFFSGRKYARFTPRIGRIFMKKLNKIPANLAKQRFLGKIAPFYGFSTVLSTFPQGFCPSKVENRGKPPILTPKKKKKGGETFTFSTVFSTEKPPQTLDFTGFSPFFDRLFAGGNSGQTVLNFWGEMTTKSDRVQTGRSLRKRLENFGQYPYYKNESPVIPSAPTPAFGRHRRPVARRYSVHRRPIQSLIALWHSKNLQCNFLSLFVSESGSDRHAETDTITDFPTESFSFARKWQGGCSCGCTVS